MNELESLLFYFFSFLVSVFFYNLYNKKNKKIFLVLSFSIPMIISGIRYNVGTDYVNYINYYKWNSYISLSFSIISKIAHLFYSYQVIFIIYSFLFLFFIFKGLKNIKKEARTFAYFCFLFLFFTTSFNIVRQMLAISIVFYSYKYMLNNDFKKYLIFILMASFFHNSALICIPFYILLNNKNNKYKFITLLLTIIIVLNLQSIINLITRIELFSHYSMYLNSYSNGISNRVFFLDFIILLYFFINKKSLINYDINNDKLYYIFLIYIVLLLSGFISPFIKRISLYFSISRLYLLPSIPYSYKKNKDKLLNYFGIIIYCFLYFIVTIYVFKQGDIIPYKSILS